MRPIALALAVMIIAIASADPLCCPDGCTRGNLTLTRHSQTGSDCPICQPGAVAMGLDDLIAGLTVTPAPLRRENDVIDSFLPKIEHPPRRSA
jgi:hypothetical protein